MKIILAEDRMLALVITETQTLVVSGGEIRDEKDPCRGWYSVGVQDVRLCVVKTKEEAEEQVRGAANFLGDGSMLRMG